MNIANVSHESNVVPFIDPKKSILFHYSQSFYTRLFGGDTQKRNNFNLSRNFDNVTHMKNAKCYWHFPSRRTAWSRNITADVEILLRVILMKPFSHD